MTGCSCTVSQEQLAKHEGSDLDRSKLASWTIEGSKVFQSIWNCLQDTFYSYDIALTDETGIQMLKEHGRKPENKSYYGCEEVDHRIIRARR